MLDELGRPLDAVLIFEAAEGELVRRLSGRTVCEVCQTPHTGREPGTACDQCGGRLVRRQDDEPEAVRNRLAVYRRQTEPVIGWYRTNHARLIPIDAAGTTADVLDRVLAALHP